MKFNVAMSSKDMQTPVHIFPGDTFENLDAYPDVIMNGYISTVATLYGAAKGMDVQFDAETFERFKRIGAAAGLIDDFLDESPSIAEAVNTYHAGLTQAVESPDSAVVMPEGVSRFLQPALRLLLNSVETLAADRKDGLIGAARAIGTLAVRKTQTNDIGSYIALLSEEADYTALLLHGAVSEEVRTQPNFPKLQEWCSNAIRLAVFADSTWDLWSDARKKRTGVQATPGNSIRIAQYAAEPFLALTKTYDTRRASRGGLLSRLRFSLWPTSLLIPRTRRAPTR